MQLSLLPPKRRFSMQLSLQNGVLRWSYHSKTAVRGAAVPPHSKTAVWGAAVLPLFIKTFVISTKLSWNNSDFFFHLQMVDLSVHQLPKKDRFSANLDHLEPSEYFFGRHCNSLVDMSWCTIRTRLVYFFSQFILSWCTFFPTKWSLIWKFVI